MINLSNGFWKEKNKNRKRYQVKSKDSLVNYQKIVFSGNEKIIHVEADSIVWGKQVLRSLNLGSLSDFENLFEGDWSGFKAVMHKVVHKPIMSYKNVMVLSPVRLGVDEFIYYASLGLGLAEQKRSLELFINAVMHAFA